MSQFECGFISGGVWLNANATTVLPCCHTDNKGKMQYSNLQYDSLINHPVLLSIRKAAIGGKVHELCQSCVMLEQQGVTSPRIRANKQFNNNGKIKQEIQYIDLETLYISISNICNFKCIICSPSESHLIAKEQNDNCSLQIIEDIKFAKLIDLVAEAKNLRKFQISGGEPFQNISRLKEIVTKVKKDILFRILSNGSIYNDEVEEILLILEQFKSATIAFSIDGHENSFEYQRVNGIWLDVLNNLKLFNKFIDNVNLVNNYTVTCFNLLDIKDFIEKYNIYFDTLGFNILKYPNEWHIRVLKTEVLEEAGDVLLSYYNSLPSKIRNKIWNIDEIFACIKESVKKSVSDEILFKFWQKVVYMDEIRGISLKEKMPNMINYITDSKWSSLYYKEN